MRIKIFSAISIIATGVLLMSVLVGWKTGSPAISAPDIEKSVNKSFLLLQVSGQTFINRSKEKCASCHHNTLTAMIAEKARQKGIPVIDSLTGPRVQAMEGDLKFGFNINLPDQFVAAKFIPAYVLPGLYAEKYPAGIYTDMAVDFMLGQQTPDGMFHCESVRVPLESGEAHLTALSIRSIQLYASASKKNKVDAAVARSRQWLENTSFNETQELAFQLLGLLWCGSSKEKKLMVAEKLKSMQRADGGWSQLETMKSDAYATGQVLYALFESGVMQATDETYQKGMAYLLKTQDESGAWIVETRAFPIQPFFTTNFPPYNENQYISATATNWAALALLEALPDRKS